MKKLTIILICFFFYSSILAQNIDGKWQGLLKVPGAELTIVFNISNEEDGYTATMDSPDQGAYGLAVQEISFEDRKLNLTMTSPSIQYEGLWNEEEEIVGTFKQGGYEFPLTISQKPVEKSISKKPQEPEKPYPYLSEDITFVNTEDNIQLAGTLTLPKEGAQFPAVVLISGSGPQDRDETILGHKPFLILSDYFTRQGIAVLRFDDRGTGKSEGEFSAATSADFVKDVTAAYRYLKDRTEIDPNKIGLVGHSEGGIIAPMVATQVKEVGFIVLMAGTGIRGDELLLRQSELVGRAAGMSESEIQMAREFNQGAYDIVVNTIHEKNVKENLKEYLEESVTKNPELATANGLKEQVFVDQMLGQLSSPWMMYFLKHDPAEALKEVDCPVLAIIGEKDLQVPSEVNLEAIENALQEGGNSNYTIKELEGLNHLFQEAKTGSPSEYGQIEQTISPKALKFMGNWILLQTK